MVHMKKLSMLLLEVILEWMHVQDYMIFIMEENRMWDVQKGEKYDTWISEDCSLKIQYLENKCRLFVDYKGYNVIMPMGMWGFEEEVQERNIQYKVDGEKGDLKSLSYIVNTEDLILFSELIRLFLTEHNLSIVLNDALKYT